jgi:hypothetical protein
MATGAVTAVDGSQHWSDQELVASNEENHQVLDHDWLYQLYRSGRC